VSILLATLVWWRINAVRRADDAAATTRDVTLVCPIRVMNVALESRIFSVIPSQAAITVRGPNELIQALTPAHLKVFVETVSSAETKGFKAEVLVTTPEGIDIVKVKPALVQVEPIVTSESNSNRPTPP